MSRRAFALAAQCLAAAEMARARMQAARLAGDEDARALAWREEARALRRLGGAIRTVEVPRDGRPLSIEDRERTARLLGVSLRQRYLALRLARVPASVFERAVCQGAQINVLEDLGRGRNYVARARAQDDNRLSSVT